MNDRVSSLNAEVERLHDLDTEIRILCERVAILMNIPPTTSKGRPHGDWPQKTTGSTPTECEDLHDTGNDRQYIACDSVEDAVAHDDPEGARTVEESLQALLHRAHLSNQQVDTIMKTTITASSHAGSSSWHQYGDIKTALLSSPKMPDRKQYVALGDMTAATEPYAKDMRATIDNPTGDDSTVTYCQFLHRLSREEGKGFVSAIRQFLYSIFGPSSDDWPGSQLNAGGREATSTPSADMSADTEVYGSSFLVKRCAEFFLAMQSAMAVHPAWAKLGYDSIVACREHLERYVMTKIHALAFGSKLDGTTDTAITMRLQALQFLSAADLNVDSHAQDEKVLAMAAEELQKMGSGRCPGDMLMRIVRCCDIIFAQLDQNQRIPWRSPAGESTAKWTPDLDPSATADDFLPVLIYVVLRANVPQLNSMCEYIEAFHSPVALMSRPGYCFVALRSAIEFLMKLDHETVAMSEQEFRRRAKQFKVESKLGQDG